MEPKLSHLDNSKLVDAVNITYLLLEKKSEINAKSVDSVFNAIPVFLL